MPCPELINTEIADVLLIRTPVFADERGFFTEAYSRDRWAETGFEATFVQDNLSRSSKGTLRGLHYQLDPHAMGKLVRVIRGAVFDVAVDLRQGSPTFGKWVGRRLDDDNMLTMWVPAGFAHGFIALEDETLVHYKCTNHYAPQSDRSLLYSDPAIGIEWPIEPVSISTKDQQAPPLAQAEYNFTYGS